MLNRKMNFFMTVVETGSFSKAAKKLYLSQSAISQQILQLEDEIGVELFNRKGYRPVLTESGEYFYKECSRILNEYDIAVENAKKISSKDKKHLRIGITGPLEKKYLPLIINEYKTKYEDIFIEVKKIKFRSGVELLEDDKLDICFGILNEFKNSLSVKTVNLLKHKVCVICSKNHKWAGRKFVYGFEIADEPIISFTKKFGELFYSDFIGAFKKDGIIPNIVQEVDDLEELLLAVKINQGIALISREVVDENDEIAVLDILDTHHSADFCVGYMKNSHKNYIEDFVDVTEEYFKKNYK